MPCQSQLNVVYVLLATVSTLIAGIIAAAITTMALSGFWVTAVFGGALTASTVCTLLIFACSTATGGLGAALVTYDNCMGRYCPQGFDRLTLALTALFIAPWATVWANVNLANGTALIPGAAIPPMIVIVASMVAMAAALIAFGILLAQYRDCVEEARRMAMPISAGSGGGGSGGSGSGSGGGSGGGGGGGGPRIRGVDGPNLLAALNRGWWMPVWPSGPLDRSDLQLEPNGKYLYTVVLDGRLTKVEISQTGDVVALQATGGEIITFDAAGRLRPQIVSYLGIGSEPESGSTGATVQGIVTENGKFKAFIGGASPFDFAPYLKR